MNIDEKVVESIVKRVVTQLSADSAPAQSDGGWGVFESMNDAVDAAVAAQQEYLRGARPSLSQNAIDQLFAGPDPAADSVPQLSKGLNEATLNMIRRFLAEHPEGLFTSEQIAEQIHLSRITIRRYMNYLVDIGEIVSSIDYKTGGRPSIQYSLGRRNYTF